MNRDFILLHADPYHPVFQDLIKNSEYSLAFYSKNKFYVYSSNQCDPSIYDVSQNQDFNQYQFDEIIAKELLLKYRQCLTRWNKHFLSDSILDSLVVSIKSIYLILLNRKCRGTVFFTASPHHLSTIILDISCCMANVDRIFLYPVVFSRRVLPIIKSGIYQESPYRYFDLNLSHYDSSRDITDFFERCNRKLLPQTNQLIRSSFVESIAFQPFYHYSIIT